MLTVTPRSQFHHGEQLLQSRAGKREQTEVFGHQAIRPFMPDQHRVFFSQLPFLVLGSVDAQGWPWASIVAGGPGFALSPDPDHLNLMCQPDKDDPLHQSLHTGAQIGVLGIEIPTRRRNRMNGRIVSDDNGRISVRVEQSFGNCPQYIQTRQIQFIRDPNIPSERNDTVRFDNIGPDMAGVIEHADTFFVASYAGDTESGRSGGVDVSHRGGRSGFVRVQGNRLTIPDYAGNAFFNSLGNFLINPKAGLIFPDFETGDVIMMTGTVELLWEDDPEILAFQGAERGWRFTLDHGLRMADALPFRADFGEWSPNSLMAGDWLQAEARLKAEQNRNQWQPYEITRIEDESSVIRSFYLRPDNKTAPLPFKAGQFLTLRAKLSDGKSAIRTYTVSSAPEDREYRISVKREDHGAMSSHLHDTLKRGDRIEAKPPRGAFFIDPSQDRPAVLLAGGVGITPMISMARHVLNEGRRTRRTRPLTIVHAAKTTEERAFARELRDIARQSGGAIRYVSVISASQNKGDPYDDVDATGRITKGLLRQILPRGEFDTFLCGPSGFMQAQYDALRALGITDDRIFAEAFGPASLQRQPDATATTPAPAEASTARVKFAASGIEQSWHTGDGTLLELAEAQGLNPAFSCRSGTCGSCTTRLLAGSVTYRTTPAVEPASGEALICCAVPAEGSDAIELDL